MHPRRAGDFDFAVEPTGPRNCGVDEMGMVTCPDHDDTLPLVRTVEALQERVDHLAAVFGVAS